MMQKSKKRWALALIFNPFNFSPPRIQHGSMKDFNGRIVTFSEFAFGYFGISINRRWSDSYDRKKEENGKG